MLAANDALGVENCTKSNFSFLNIFIKSIIDEKTDYVSCWKNADSDRIEELQVKWDAYQEELERKKNQNMQDSDVVFSENITFEFEVVDNGTYIPYALYTPSTASTSGDIPLIVWLHGATDESTNQAKIETRGLPRAIAEWDLLNFNAYVVAPQITSGWHVAWYNSSGKNAVDSVVAYLIENYNIDTNKIIIAGHSNGGIGALYMAVNDNNNYYAAVVSISGGRPANLSSLKIPVHGYTGEKDYTSNYNFTMHTLGNLFGSENVFNIIGSDHAQVSWTAFELDEDGNNRSDAIEWILEQSKE